MYLTNTLSMSLQYIKMKTSENPCVVTTAGNVLLEVPFYNKISIFDIINYIFYILISQNCVTFSI